MSVQRIVVVGASSGGVEALRVLAAGLPPDLAAPVCVVIHRHPHSAGLIAEILDRSGPLRAHDARPEDRLENGHIYVAPVDRHLLVEPGQLRLSRGPRENLSRPAIDPLFRSAAQVYGPATVGVILTGDLDDGAAGLETIRRLGGVTIVQDPDDAFAPSMPENALRYGAADFRVPLREIPTILQRVVERPTAEVTSVRVPRNVEVEVNIAKEEAVPMEAGLDEIADPSMIACPECHGVLLRLKHEQPSRFRCHTGHGYSAESLIAALNTGVEESLWGAVRALEEAGMLLSELAHLEAHHTGGANDLRARARQTETEAAAIREILQERSNLQAR
jgi:two-component system, chemotaxis family, protein-glutamate methylesterase/glutaminase